MLGEKYGWIPDVDQLSDQIKNLYDWMPKVSITFMEFLHGALRSNNKNSCFFIRTKESLDGIPNDYHDKFYESNKFSKFQLVILKEKLKHFFPNRVFEYSAKYDSIDETTGRKKSEFLIYNNNYCNI